ncbi:MAG: hypothetical protein M1830_008809 [Pleopsidium flavum]|nr:MAG: hypothetical protein M1830_008809 [Pleopsidium flavum]
MAEITPRINAPYLGTFTGQTVRVLGKVVQLRGETAVVDAGGRVNVLLNRDSHLVLNNAIEIVGKVQQDLSIKVFQATDFGNNIDYAAFDAVVDASHRYKDIFYADNEQ